jgi:hypothetical protein
MSVRRLLPVGVAAAMVVMAGPAVGALAGTSPDGVVTVTAPAASIVLPPSGCVPRSAHPFSVTVQNITVPWTMAVTWQKTGGSSKAVNGDSGTGPTATPFLAGPGEYCAGAGKLSGPGTYTLTASVTWNNGTTNVTSTASGSTTFTAFVPIPTMMAASFTSGHPDIVRAHLFTAAQNLYKEGLVLEDHNAVTSNWTVVGIYITDTNGWTYAGVQPKYWTAFRWVFKGNTEFAPSVSPAVATP